jgi:hypothetical protein
MKKPERSGKSSWQQEEAEAVQRWNDRVAEAQARKVVEQQIEDVLIYGK